MAEVTIFQAKCTQSFVLDKDYSKYKASKEDFTMSLVIDMDNKKAYTKGTVGQSELFLASVQPNGITLLEKVMEGVVIYHMSFGEKKLFISKTYDWTFTKAPVATIITIVCDLN